MVITFVNYKRLLPAPAPLQIHHAGLTHITLPRLKTVGSRETLKIILLSCCIYLFTCPSYSQNVQFRQDLITNLSDAKFSKVVEDVNFNGLGGNFRIPFSMIRGSRFWKEDWELADLFTASAKASNVEIKLNLLTGEIHFKKDNEEMVIEGLRVEKIFFKKDSITFLANVPNLYVQNNKMNAPVLLLSSGKYQLLKYIQRNLATADSLFRTQKRYYFSDRIYYFLKHNDVVEPIKKLSKENLFKLLPSANSYNEWAVKNNINFKKEEDVILFINHYNSFRENQ